jgi:hypothetical protein
MDCLLSFLPGSSCAIQRVALTCLPDEPDAAFHEFVWENERAVRACAPGFIEAVKATRRERKLREQARSYERAMNAVIRQLHEMVLLARRPIKRRADDHLRGAVASEVR